MPKSLPVVFVSRSNLSIRPFNRWLEGLPQLRRSIVAALAKVPFRVVRMLLRFLERTPFRFASTRSLAPSCHLCNVRQEHSYQLSSGMQKKFQALRRARSTFFLGRRRCEARRARARAMHSSLSTRAHTNADRGLARRASRRKAKHHRFRNAARMHGPRRRFGVRARVRRLSPEAAPPIGTHRQ